MKRLTTDDTESILQGLNLFFVKDREVWIRGGGPEPDYPDCTLTDWINRAAAAQGIELDADDPEHLGDVMYDCLQYGTDATEGILALLHTAAVQAAEMRERLKMLEDILGDEYSPDHMRELVEADQQLELQRHLKRFDIKPPISYRPESGLAKYIDVEAFVRELAEACDEIDLRFLRGRAVKEAIDTVKNHISAMPDADVAPVVHGHWVPTVPPLGAGDAELRCSVCGRVYHEKNAPYCYCGAKMDGESPT